MSRNRTSNRKNRTFHIESLERREMMSVAPWQAELAPPDQAASVSVGPLTPGQNALSGSSAPNDGTANLGSLIDTWSPFSATVSGNTLVINAAAPGYIGVFEKVNDRGERILSLGGQFGDLAEFVGYQEIPLGSIDQILYNGSSFDDWFMNRTSIAATAYGGAGNDRLEGGSNRDVLIGGDGNDELYGYDGNDELRGDAGNDKLYGGNGNDTLVARDGVRGNDVINGGAGTNSIVDDTGTVATNDSVPEATIDGQGRVRIQGTIGADTVSVGLSGREVVVKFNGREKRFAAAAVRVVEFRGGSGNDYFTNNTSIVAEAYGDDGSDTLHGGSGRDVLRGGAGNDFLEGFGGNDSLHGDAGNDTIGGGAGNDEIYGGDARDFLFGDDGNDWIYGGFGNDELYGGRGDDNLDGEAGDDWLKGENGNDRLVSRDATVGNDQLFGGQGDDWFDAPLVEIKQR